jgi:predicted ATPase/DNA-binding SARP family transcriptional activator/DNA-binding CsgD family transcriptional regulator
MEQQVDRYADCCNTLRIQLLGGVCVRICDHAVSENDFRLRNASRLVKLLALAPGHVLHRDEVMDWLWPELPPDAASNNLRYTLHVARRVLRPLSSQPSDILTLAGQQVRLAPAGCVLVDVEEFEQAFERAQRSLEPGRWQAVLQHYGGELLPGDRYEDWTASRRESLREMYLQALTASAAECEQAGKDEQAIAALEQAIALDPAREEAHVGLMRLYALRGQRQRALRQYSRMRDALLDELDVEPERVSQALYQAILLGHFPSSEDTISPVFASADVLVDVRHNLPEPQDTFIGRQREVQETSGLLQATRFLSLTGSGGVGKTRLALEVARMRSTREREDIWFIDLSSLTRQTDLAGAILPILDLTETPGTHPVDQITRALSQSPALVILDNCEHLIESVASLAGELVRSCPGVRLLTTSREPLRVTGEVTYRVPSLALPGDRLPDFDDPANQAESVQLFVQRATRHESGFQFNNDSAPLVAEICRALDGIPLAIELAAARASTSSLAEMLTSLGSAMHLKEHRNRSAPDRHQTVHNALDWSYRLLSLDEQRLFRTLAVFAGGWTLEAAEAVGDNGQDSPAGIINLLASLVDRSLVVLDAGRTGLRYRMLEPVRQYATNLLDISGETTATRNRHAGYTLAFVTSGEPGLRGATQGEWISRYEAERDNLRAALHWTIETDPETALKIAAGTGRFWYVRSHGVEGRSMLHAVLDAAPEGDPATRARVLSHAGILADEAGEHVLAGNLLNDALKIFRDLHDQRGMATALNSLGGVARSKGDLQRSLQLFEESLKIREQLGDEQAINLVKSNLAAVVMSAGELDRAEILLEETILYDQATGNEWSEAITLAYLGRINWERGEYLPACDRLLRSCSLADSTGDQGAVCDALEIIAGAVGALGSWDTAARLWGAAQDRRERISLPTPEADMPFLKRMVDSSRQTANSAAFDEAWSAGQKLSLDEAVCLAEQEIRLLRDRPERQHQVLTAREQEIVALITRGQTNAQIAATLGIAVRTVDTHVSRILRKLGVHSRSEITTDHQSG